MTVVTDMNACACVPNRRPIEAGLPADAKLGVRELSHQKQLELHQICERFVHRVDAKQIR